MKIDVWSDVYCPWCYIGKRRLDRALAQFEHRADLQIRWHSFELDPSAPRAFDGDINDMLSKKYGMTRAQADAAHQKLTALAAQDGLQYRFDLAKPGNTFDAHRLLHFAATMGLTDKLQERLMHGYFTEGLAIGDREAISKIAAEVGLPRDQVDDVLSGDLFGDAVRHDQQEAYALGIRGVPAFVFNRKYLVSGAQSVEILLRSLQRAWDELTLSAS